MTNSTPARNASAEADPGEVWLSAIGYWLFYSSLEARME